MTIVEAILIGAGFLILHYRIKDLESQVRNEDEIQ